MKQIHRRLLFAAFLFISFHNPLKAQTPALPPLPPDDTPVVSETPTPAPSPLTTPAFPPLPHDLMTPSPVVTPVSISYRESFMAGIKAVNEKRWDDALASFKTAEDLVQTPLDKGYCDKWIDYANKQKLVTPTPVLTPADDQASETFTPMPVMPDVTPTRADKRLRGPKEAVREWIKFRSYEETMRGQFTTWRMKVFFRTDSYYLCSLGGNPKYKVKLLISDPRASQFASSILKEQDFLMVTGRFQGITPDNEVIFNALRLKDLGYEP